MSEFDFDLFVIGGGSGGVRAARLAAGLGKKVAIAEEYRFGGTCVIRGCVPKKLFVYASQFSEHFEDARGYGWSVGESAFDWPALIANKDREIDRLAFASGAPPKPTTAVIEQAEIIWGSSTLGLNGELRAGSNGYVEGYLEFDVEGWQPLFDIYNSAARMSATEKLTLKRALDAASGGGNLAFTLRFSGGEASIGPFTIGPAPVYPF